MEASFLAEARAKLYQDSSEDTEGSLLGQMETCYKSGARAEWKGAQLKRPAWRRKLMPVEGSQEEEPSRLGNDH